MSLFQSGFLFSVFSLQENKNGQVVSSSKTTLYAAIIFSLILNAKIWQIYFDNFQLDTFEQLTQAICFFLFLYFLLVSLFTLFSLPWIQKPFLISIFMISCPAMYFSLAYGTFFDTSMLQNVIETDQREAFDLVTDSFLIVTLFTGLIPSFIVYKTKIVYPAIWKQLSKNIFLIMVSIPLAFASLYPYYGDLSFFIRNNNKKLQNSFLPSAPIYATYKNFRSITNESNISKQIIDSQAKIEPPVNSLQPDRKPLVLVVIIGETAREKSFSVQHIESPNSSTYLSQSDLLEHKNLTYFSNFWSCGTNTALSVPCMFSTFPKDLYTRDMNRKNENVAELIQRIGYDLIWRDNNSGCQGICSDLINVPVNMTNSAQFAHDDEFYDEALVDDLESRIRSKNNDQVIFLHQMGSHGPAYFKRVPDKYKTLQPACRSANFSDCTQQEIINAYDNTILYTKHVINSAIEKLESIEQNYDTALLYLSDHGESTGENGLYLHGIPYFMAPTEQTHIPALLWLSDGYITRQSINMGCLKEKKDNRFSHDNFSHTLLGLLNISTSVYKKQNDLLNGCVK